MSDAMYLTIMLSLLALNVVILVPLMFRTRCRGCGVWNRYDEETCRGCGAELPKR